jgi:putative membrane protein
MRVASYSRFVPVSLVLMCLMLAAGLAQAADTNPQPLNPDEQAFLARAMSDNASQVAMAKMALNKSTNPRVIDLANTIIQERTTLDTQLAQLVGNTKHEQPVADAAMDHLQSLNGDAFDRTFASSAVRNHCRLISAYQAIKMTSSNPALKDVAHQAIPALRGNLTVALSVLRSRSLNSAHPQEAVASVDARGSKASVFWEPISLVAAPW